MANFKRDDDLVKTAVHGVTVNAYVVLEPELKSLQDASDRETIFLSLFCVFLGAFLGGLFGFLAADLKDGAGRGAYICALVFSGAISAVCAKIWRFEYGKRAGLLAEVKKRGEAARLTGVTSRQPPRFA
jgi:hypothetical protein